MSAHVLTALNEVTGNLADGKVAWGHLQAALNISCWTEQLDLGEYIELTGIVAAQDAARLDAWIKSVYPAYQRQWERLEQPRTREEWINRLYEAVVVRGEPRL